MNATLDDCLDADTVCRANKRSPRISIKWLCCFCIWFVLCTSALAQDEKVTNLEDSANLTTGSSLATNDSYAMNDTNTSNETTTTTEPPPDPLPPEGAAEEEHKSSMAIFFIMFVMVLSILVVHLLIITKFHYLPESLAIILLGFLVGMLSKFSKRDWTNEEAFNPNTFFLFFLPPIIFESGYNLHKGNFFANIGSILVFAILGTFLSALVIGGGIYLLGLADLIYPLSSVESFAFGSMISAVDPVATLAIFQALDMDPILYMLVFGESVLNDAVAIVLTTTISELNHPNMESLDPGTALATGLGRFAAMFFGSAALGAFAALASALLLKHVDLRKTPSLEFGIMLIFSYLPYGLAEGLHLSGIMSILFCGIVMSHYTHFNLSPLTQLTMQLTLRTLAFIAESCVFAYLGMAFFIFPLKFETMFVVWTILLCLISRAANIFPLSFLVNYFREHKITRKMQFIMWFSGLRGAIAFALSLHTEFDEKTRHVLVTTTLILVVFTTLIMGGSTMPLMKILDKEKKPPKTSRRKRRRSHRDKPRAALIKTQEIGGTVKPTFYSDSETGTTSAAETPVRLPSVDLESHSPISQPMSYRRRGFEYLDTNFLRPFFTRKFTTQEKRESTVRLTDLAMKWYEQALSETDDEEDALGDISNDADKAPLIVDGSRNR